MAGFTPGQFVDLIKKEVTLIRYFSNAKKDHHKLIMQQDQRDPGLYISRIRSDDPSLSVLCLNGGRSVLTQLNESIASELAAALPHNTHLRKIGLRQNPTATPTIVMTLLDALRSCANPRFHYIKDLDLAENPKLDDRVGQAIVQTILHHSTLRNVDVSGTAITKTVREDIAYAESLNDFPAELKRYAYLAKHNDAKTFGFHLEYNAFDPRSYNEASTKAIVDSLRDNTTVRSLKLDQCCPGIRCMHILSELIRTTRHLATLSLKNNRLDSDCVRVIVQALQDNPAAQLETLNISNNEIDDDGAIMLVDYLGSAQALRYVFFENNPLISEPVAIKLRSAAALNCEPPALKALIPQLTNISIDDSAASKDDVLEVINLEGREEVGAPSKGYLTNLGMRTLAHVLMDHPTVHTLNLMNNHIGPDGAAALGKLLAQNRRLTSLNVSGNPLTDEGLRHLCIGLAKNDHLVTCNVERCGGSERLESAIQDVCRLNTQPVPIKQLYADRRYFTGDLAFPSIVDLTKQRQDRGKLQQIDWESIKLLRETLMRHHHAVEMIQLDDNRLSFEGVDRLCVDIIEANFAVPKLSLRNCDLDDRCVARLVNSLQSNYRCVEIDVSRNRLVSVRAELALRNALLLNTYPSAFKDVIPLVNQSIGGVPEVCFVSKQAKRALAAHAASVSPELNGSNSPSLSPTRTSKVRSSFEGITSNTSPGVDATSDMQLGDDGARLLFAALRTSTSVRSVRLIDQDISNRGVGYLCDCLTRNSTLHDIDLRGNDIGKDGAVELAAALVPSTTAPLPSGDVLRVDLRSNHIGEVGVAALLDAMDVRRWCPKGPLREVLIDDNRCYNNELQDAIRLRTLLAALPISYRRALFKHLPRRDFAAEVADRDRALNGSITESPPPPPDAAMEASTNTAPPNLASPQSPKYSSDEVSNRGLKAPMIFWDRTTAEARRCLWRMPSVEVRGSLLAVNTKTESATLAQREAAQSCYLNADGMELLKLVLLEQHSLFNRIKKHRLAVALQHNDDAVYEKALQSTEDDCTIESLRLVGHQFQKAGIEQLAAALRVVPSCKSVDLSYCDVGVESFKALHNLLLDSPWITTLDLTGNPMMQHPKEATMLNDAVRANRQTPAFRVFRRSLAKLHLRALDRLILRGLDTDADGIALLLHSICPVEFDLASVSEVAHQHGDVLGASFFDKSVSSTTQRSSGSTPQPPVITHSSQSATLGSSPPATLSTLHTASVGNGGTTTQPGIVAASPARIPLPRLASVDISNNPRLDDIGVRYLSRWIACCAPQVRQLLADRVGISCDGLDALRQLVWASPHVISCSVEEPLRVHPDDATQQLAITESVELKVNENITNQKEQKAVGEIRTKLAEVTRGHLRKVITKRTGTSELNGPSATLHPYEKITTTARTHIPREEDAPDLAEEDASADIIADDPLQNLRRQTSLETNDESPATRYQSEAILHDEGAAVLFDNDDGDACVDDLDDDDGVMKQNSIKRARRFGGTLGDKVVDTYIMRDALRDQPKRAKYVRGMYAQLYQSRRGGGDSTTALAAVDDAHVVVMGADATQLDE